MKSTPKDLMRRKLLAMMRAHALEARSIMREIGLRDGLKRDFYATCNRAANYLQLACDYRNMARRLQWT